MAKATLKLEQRKDSKTGELKEKNVPILIDFTFDGKRMWVQTGEHTDRTCRLPYLVNFPICQTN